MAVTWGLGSDCPAGPRFPRSLPHCRGMAPPVQLSGDQPPVSSFLSCRRPCPVPPSAGSRPVLRSVFSCHGGRGQCFSATLRHRRFRWGWGLASGYCDTSLSAPGSQRLSWLFGKFPIAEAAFEEVLGWAESPPQNLRRVGWGAEPHPAEPRYRFACFN